MLCSVADGSMAPEIVSMKKALFPLLFLLLLAGLFFSEIRSAVLSGLIMLDVMRYGRPPLLRYVSPDPMVSVVRYSGGGREMEADLYQARQGRAGPAIVLIHGVNEQGRSDPRIRWAAQMLCRVGFQVLVPDFQGFKSLRLRPSDIAEIADSFLYLSSRPDLSGASRLGMAGFSYGAGPTVIAACDPRIRERVSFLISFGGYYDLSNVTEFVTTGHYSYQGRSYIRPPNDYTRWIFLRYNLDLLQDEGDRRLLQEAEGWKVKGEERQLRRRLSPEGRAVYDLITNRDPAQVRRLLSQLPLRLQAYVQALSPSHYLKDLRAYCFIIHGVPDDFIPHTESLRLADALSGPDRSRLVLLRIFTHVRPTLPPPTLSNLLFIYIPEGIKFFSLTYHLLRLAT